MAGTQLRIMLDANAWLDFFIEGRVGSATASRLVRSAASRNAELFYPSHVIEDLFLEIRRDAVEWVRSSTGEVTRDAARIRHDYAWDCMEDLHELATAVATDDADVLAALRYRSLSENLEDNLVLVAAQRAGADYLVTTDQVLLSKATIAALTPQDMLTVLEAGLVSGAPAHS